MESVDRSQFNIRKRENITPNSNFLITTFIDNLTKLDPNAEIVKAMKNLILAIKVSQPAATPVVAAPPAKIPTVCIVLHGRKLKNKPF